MLHVLCLMTNIEHLLHVSVLCRLNNIYYMDMDRCN